MPLLRISSLKNRIGCFHISCGGHGPSLAVFYNRSLIQRLLENPYSLPSFIIVIKIFIDRWSVYGCKSLVTSRPHSNPIVKMGIMVLMITNMTYVPLIIVTKIFIDRWSVYGCKSLVTSRPHSDPIVNMAIIAPVITNRTHVHALHHLLHLAHLLLQRLLELLEFGSPKSFPVTSSVVKGILTVGKGIDIEVITVV